MKINAIRFKNINSLQGEHVIHFDKSPLSEAGLFLITGATGSGKSTLLDVITLALYNKIPRLNTSISDTIIDVQGVILTKNTNDCYAEVEFKVKSINYRASWSIERAKSGKFKARNHSISEIETGIIIENRLKDVPIKIEEIIGLSYDQFVQSLLLAQGQFAKLLFAEKDNRNKLLEDITNTHQYRHIGIAAFRRYRHAEAAKNEMMTRIEEVSLLDPEIIEEHIKNIEALTSSETTLKAEQKVFDTHYKIKIDLEKTNQLLTLNSSKTEQLNLAEKQFATNREQLENHTKCIHLKEPLNKYENSISELFQLNQELSELKTEGIKTKEQLNALIIKSSHLTNQDIVQDTMLQALNQFQNEITELHEKEKELKQTIKSYTDRIKDGVESLKVKGVHIEINDELQHQITTLDSESNTFLKTNKFQNIDTTRSEKDRLNTLIMPAIELIESKKTYKEKSLHLQSQEKNLLELVNQTTQINQELLIEKELETSKIKTLKKLEQDVEKINKLKSFESHRLALVPQEPCPLCGSEHHPYYDGHLTEQTEQNAVELALKETKVTVESLSKKIAQYEAKIAFNTEKIKTENIEINEKSFILEENKSRLLSLCKPLEWNFEESETNWQLQLDLWKKEIDVLIEIEKRYSIIQSTSLILEQFDTYNSLKKSYQEIQNSRKKLFPDDNYQEIIERLKTDLQLQLQQIDLQKKIQIEIFKKTTQTTETSTQLLNELNQSCLSLKIASIEQLKEFILSEQKAQEYRTQQQTLLSQRAILNEEKQTLTLNFNELFEKNNTDFTKEEIEQKLITIQTTIEDILEQRGQLKQVLEQDVENRKKFAKYEEELGKLRAQLDIWSTMNKLIGDADGKRFSNFVQDITLRQLIQLGNVRLQKFSDRYLLDIPEGNLSSLTIIDTHMGNSKRAVTTLSGGESFMISLALAFGLSDFSSKNVNIESLFIDEGFGSLDEESLDEAISILEHMQSESNKSIGIISHVSELKERIGTKIRLTKGGNGYSTIAIEG